MSSSASSPRRTPAGRSTSREAGNGQASNGRDPFEFRLPASARKGDRTAVVLPRPLRAGQPVTCVFGEGAARETCPGRVDYCRVESISAQGLTYDIGIVLDGGAADASSAPTGDLPDGVVPLDPEAQWIDDMPDFEVLFDQIEDADE
ncbi:MAG: hypothetical protein KJ061_08465 [Vicinamibacteraceae bacterium]|nr:hypothetical protein [Vicinamibacteraceae bacterium]